MYHVRERIEAKARQLQDEVYRRRDELWPNVDIPPLWQMFSPEAAAKVLGIRYQLEPGLGGFGDGNSRFEVAGLIDRQAKKIAVSQRFNPTVQRFTGAHEIGHWMLHKSGIVLHRDRQLDGIAAGRGPQPRIEREANYFSACYLIQDDALRDEFAKRFGPLHSFRFNEDAAFGLCPSNPRSLIGSPPESREWELALAFAIGFHGTRFDSLAESFLVSPLTMAIRLREIGLRG